MTRRAVFLDVDGVMLDPPRTGAEWERLIGDVLAPALGGTPEEWGRANADVFPRVFADRGGWYHDDPIEAERRLVTEIFQGACEFLGLPLVSADDAVSLGRKVDAYVGRHTRAAFPRTVEVIRTLSLTFQLHTATGNPSWRIEPMLQRWGVRDLFGVLPGIDLAGAMKNSDAFYPAVFALAEVDAPEAVVVDDDGAQVLRARALGATTVLVHGEGTEGADTAAADLVIANIEELPAALQRLD
jgi:phosphoglycolate phosphatase-like HAD superfamily hydrolase